MSLALVPVAHVHGASREMKSEQPLGPAPWWSEALESAPSFSFHKEMTCLPLLLSHRTPFYCVFSAA
jgi:hypothetical protein